MAHLTLNLDTSTIKKMKSYYHAQLDQNPQGAIFRARTSHAVITAYRSGKVLFQGNNVEAEANKWRENSSIHTPTQETKHTIYTYTPPKGIFTQAHIGSDESGTGDYFGPVTTAAVYVTAEQIPILKQLGIQDSKAIQDDKIKVLSKELAKMNIPYSLMILHNEKYNLLQMQGWSQGKMKAMLHHATIQRLMGKIGNASYQGIIIDQFCQPTVYKKHLTSEQLSIPPHTYFMTKAEYYSIAVAAGSVIARASFLQEMGRLSEQMGHQLLKGASKKVDQLIATIILTKGEDALNKIAKVHFANTKKAKKYI